MRQDLGKRIILAVGPGEIPISLNSVGDMRVGVCMCVCVCVCLCMCVFTNAFEKNLVGQL